MRCCSFGSRNAESEGRVFPAIRVVEDVRLGSEIRRPDWRKAPPSGRAERALEIDVRKFELDLVGASRGHGEVNTPHAHLRPELQELETNGLGRGIGELGKAQTDAA